MATEDRTSDAVEPVEGSWSPKRPRTAAEQRAQRSEGSTDPEVLADDIEKTREELAETLDAIADKVSPKKVVKRTTKKAGDAAKEGVHDAVEAVKETAASATAAVKGTAADVKDKVAGDGGSDPDRSPLAPATSVEVGSATPATGAPSPLPAATQSVAVAPDVLAPEAGDVPPASTTGSLADAADRASRTVEPAGADLPPSTPPAYVPPASPSKLPVLAGAGAALAVALLLMRRRRR